MPEPATVPEVTVVVPTRNRARLLGRLLAALEEQTLDPARFEVVVVDDSSDDGTADLLARTLADTGLRLRSLRTCRRRGPAAARNLGWRSSQAPVVAFTDDDCVPAPTWLEAGMAALGSGARCVVGRTAPDPAQLRRARRAFARSISVESVRFYETCNVFYRRDDLASVGGFDERFRRPSGEDTALGLTLAERGVASTFTPEALVHHEVWSPGWRAVLLETLRWVDLPLVVATHPQVRSALRFRIFWRDAHPWALCVLAALLLARRRPWTLLLVLPWLDHRLRRDPVCPGPRRRVLALPGALVLDLTEVGVMAAGSLRHRTVML